MTFVPEGACTFAGAPTSLILPFSISTAAGESTLPVRGSSKRPALTIVIAALELAATQIRSAKAAIRLITRLSLLRPGRESRPDRGHETVPAVRFFLQPLPSLASQLIIFGPAIVVRFIPFRREQALAHQAEEGWIKRALFDQKRAFGNLAD